MERQIFYTKNQAYKFIKDNKIVEPFLVASDRLKYNNKKNDNIVVKQYELFENK